MDNAFCKFPQTRFWDEVHEHLLLLPGATVTGFVDHPAVGSWLDFLFRGCSFKITAESGAFALTVHGTGCPASVQAEVATHFGSRFGADGEAGLRRV